MRTRSATGLAVAALTAAGSAAALWAAPAGAQTPTSGQRAAAKHAAKSATCNTDTNWPAYAQGAPDAFDAGDDGAYLWHNPSGGWGLRVSHPLLPGKANRVVFTGTITSKGTISGVKKVRDEKGDVAKVGPGGHTLRFRFVDYGGVDGVDFVTTCTPGLRVSLDADRSPMGPQFVHLGDKKVNPGTDPFRIRRRDTDTATLPVAGKAPRGSSPKKQAPKAQPGQASTGVSAA